MSACALLCPSLWLAAVSLLVHQAEATKDPLCPAGMAAVAVVFEAARTSSFAVPFPFSCAASVLVEVAAAYCHPWRLPWKPASSV